MNRNDVIIMLENLNSEKLFSEFKLKKSDKSLVRKFDWGWQRVLLDHYNSIDIERNELALQVTPYYDVRFNILHEWFEKFSHTSHKDLKDRFSIRFDEQNLGKSKFFWGFYFLESRIDYDLDYENMKIDILEHASFVFNRFHTINDLYDYKVVPILEGKKDFSSSGVEWIFQYLLMTRIVNSENYAHVKEMILKHVDTMRTREHPELNVMRYYGMFPEILSYIESMPLDDIPSELIRK